MTKYDAWRIYDREMLKVSGKTACIRKIMVRPALLARAFGKPWETKIGFEGSGDYDFEDVNLDLFNLYDYKQTDFYWGPNREDAYYERDLKLAPHKRRRKWPTIEEFWGSMEPKEFKLACTEQADWRKFRLWLLREVEKAAEQKQSYYEQAVEKFDKEIDICVGNEYSKKSPVNTNMAIYNYDYTYFMSADALKKLKDKP